MASTFFLGAWTDGLIVFVDDDADFFHETNLFIVVALGDGEINVVGRSGYLACGCDGSCH